MTFPILDFIWQTLAQNRTQFALVALAMAAIVAVITHHFAYITWTLIGLICLFTVQQLVGGLG